MHQYLQYTCYVDTQPTAIQLQTNSDLNTQTNANQQNPIYIYTHVQKVNKTSSGYNLFPNRQPPVSSFPLLPDITFHLS